MAGISRRQVRRLERDAKMEVTTLVCPECGEEFVVVGDVAAEFICYDWAQTSGEKSYRKHPEDVIRIYEHEHKPSNFVEKSSGLPFLGKLFSGMDLGVAPEDVEDLSEP